MVRKAGTWLDLESADRLIRVTECCFGRDRYGRFGKPIAERAAAAGVPVSQYLADLLAVHVGRPDLVSDDGRREVLPLAMGTAPGSRADGNNSIAV